MSAPSPAADRNLLFGILALQLDFLSKDTLIGALHAWVLDKAKPLGQILTEQGQLTPDLRQLLEAMVDKHIQVHQGDPQQSLAAVSSVSSVRHELQQIADDDVQASLAQVSVGAESQDAGTASYHSADSAAPAMRYRVLRPHARGGLGEVFVAEDTELHREVALKEIRPEHAGNQDSRGRFVLEAEITGGLEHPGIVPVYGLGQYDDGRPFYAMRFIKGDNLREAIRRFHKADTAPRDPTERNIVFRDLLGRFVDVCNAVAYAHSRGILHRDLKPGNVMLGKYGETLVVDWGLAKVAGRVETLPDPGEPTLRPSSADSSLAATRMGTAVGTPAFMSPEQAAGRLDLLGPASDIYSLGATLYAVLTGQAPFRGESGEILRQVQRGAFAPPRQVKAAVPAALEAVCRKAMALRPEERYQTALQLAEDVEHWLADEPVRAWPEPVTVKLGRWARQHKPLVSGAAATLLVGVLALGTGAFWYQQLLADRAAEEAVQEERAAYARQQTEQEVRRALQQATTLRETLQRALAKVGGVRQLLNDPAHWKGQLQEAQLHWDKARVLLAQAGEGGDSQLAQQLHRLKQQLTQDEADRQLAQLLEQVRMEKSVLIENTYYFAPAERNYPKVFAKTGLAVQDGELQAVSTRIRHSAIKEQLVAALDDWAFVAWRMNQKALAERLLQVARLADPDPWRDRLRDPAAWTKPETVKALADQLLNNKTNRDQLSPQMLELVGSLLASAQGDLEGWLRPAQARHPQDFWLSFNLAGALHKAKPGEAAGYLRVALAVRPQSTDAWFCLGIVLKAHKDPRGAAAAYRKAVDIDPQFAEAWNGLGVVLNDDQKDPKGAAVAFQKALDVNPRFAVAWHNLGNALYAQKDVKGAVAAYSEAVAIDPEYASAWYNLGNALLDQRDPKGAVTAYQKAIDVNPDDAKTWYGLGRALYDQNDPKGAMVAYQKAVKIDPRYGKAWSNLGNALRDLKDPKGAVAAYQKAIDVDPQLPNPWIGLGLLRVDQNDPKGAGAAFRKATDVDPQFAPAWNNLGNALAAQQDPKGAAAAYQKALAIDPQNAETWCNLGITKRTQKDLKEAVAAYQQALKINPQHSRAWSNLGNALRDQKDLKGAVAAYHRALAIDPQLALAWRNLGNALYDQQDLKGTVAALRKAVALAPHFVEAHVQLGQTLLAQGELAQAHTTTLRALQLLPQGHPMRGPVQQLLELCQQTVMHEQRALDLVQGRAAPANPAELLQLAQFCRQYHRPYTAARLYTAAFAAQPDLADDLVKGHRYQAASAAAQAAAGHGLDAHQFPDKDKTKLRRQALDWLRADRKLLSQAVTGYLDGSPASGQKPVSPLERLTGSAPKPGPADLLRMYDRLRHWQIDPDLVSLRAEKELVKLPAAEQTDWRQLWADVQALEKQARACFTERQLSGNVTAQHKEHVQEVKLQGGKVYAIDLESTAFDAYLRLEDDQGKKLAENDDIEPGVNLNSRIVFTPKESGTYRLVASALQGQGTGAFVLRIREFAGKK